MRVKVGSCAFYSTVTYILTVSDVVLCVACFIRGRALPNVDRTCCQIPLY